MLKNHIKAILFMFGVFFSYSEAKAEQCLIFDTSRQVEIRIGCGFNLLPSMLGEKTKINPGQKICKSNKILFLTVPCSFEVHRNGLSCATGLHWGGSTIIKDDVLDEKITNTNQPRYCRLH